MTVVERPTCNPPADRLRPQLVGAPDALDDRVVRVSVESLAELGAWAVVKEARDKALSDCLGPRRIDCTKADRAAIDVFADGIKEPVAWDVVVKDATGAGPEVGGCALAELAETSGDAALAFKEAKAAFGGAVFVTSKGDR